MKLSTKERRFLIRWIAICLLGWFVNFAHIEGSMSPTFSKTIFNSWTTNGKDENDFWPFTKFTEYYSFAELKTGGRLSSDYSIPYDQANIYQGTHFYGIFKSFNFIEFIVYSLIGCAIIFIPKIW